MKVTIHGVSIDKLWNTYLKKKKRNFKRVKICFIFIKFAILFYLGENLTHFFTWKVINDAPLNDRERKHLEAVIIAIKRPVLNEKVDPNLICLFRFGITYSSYPFY